MATTIKIGQSEAVGLLEALGYEGAEDLSVSKLTNTLKKVPADLEEEEEEPDVPKKFKKLLASVVAAKSVKVIEDEEEEDDEEEEEAPKKKGKSSTKKTTTKSVKGKTAKGTKGKSVKKKSAPRKDAAEKDKFGSREGTSASAINALIVSKPRSLEWIKGHKSLKGVKSNRVQSHIRFLKERDFIKIMKDGKIAEK